MKKNEMSLEKAFDALDKVIAELDRDDIPLESAFEQYDEGMKLVKQCREKLDLYERKLIIVNEGAESIEDADGEEE